VVRLAFAESAQRHDGKETAMKRSTTRILTTHTASRPRPPNLVSLLMRSKRGRTRTSAAWRRLRVWHLRLENSGRLQNRLAQAPGTGRRGQARLPRTVVTTQTWTQRAAFIYLPSLEWSVSGGPPTPGYPIHHPPACFGTPPGESASTAFWVKTSFTRPCGPGWVESRRDPGNLGEIHFVEVHVCAEY
jgi:hypothetical protein